MKDKKTGLIQALIGAVILIIGIVLCVNTYIVKGNKAYLLPDYTEHFQRKRESL